MYQTMNKNVSSMNPTKLEYDFLEDLKKIEANISQFELMKIPQIQENFIKTLQGNPSKNMKEANVGTMKGKGKVELSQYICYERLLKLTKVTSFKLQLLSGSVTFDLK